jgi:hypothetical protein
MFDQRSERRIEPSAEHAVLEHRGLEHSVRVLNISSSGAMIAFHTVPHIGERVRLHQLGSESMAGFVRWVRDGRVGINFDRPVAS